MPSESKTCEAARAEFAHEVGEIALRILEGENRQCSESRRHVAGDIGLAAATKAAEIFAGTQHSDELAGLRQVVELSKVQIEQLRAKLKEQQPEVIEELAGLKHDYEELREDVKRFRQKLACKGSVVDRDERTHVWLVKSGDSAARDLACRAMNVLGMDSANDFRTRDKIIMAISERLDAMLDDAAAIAPQPEVIEGRGQRVTAEQSGRWLFERRDGSSGLSTLLTGDKLAEGYRYMRCPTFPPRKPFNAPPKPEHTLIRRQVDGITYTQWASGTPGSLLLRVIDSGDIVGRASVEILDPATGEVKQ